MSYLTSMWLIFNAYSHSNPMVAGAVSLWGLGVVTWVFRKIPRKIISKIHGQLVTTLTFDNTDLGWSRENYAAFMEWYMKSRWVRYSSQLALQTYGTQFGNRLNGHGSRNAADVAIGDGNHFFFFKRRLFLMHRRALEKIGVDSIVYVVKLTMLGRDKTIMQELVDVFCHKFPENKLKLMRFDRDYWVNYATLDRRELKTVIIEKALKRALVKAIEDFQMNEAWYAARGLPWKKTFVLHGVPGTGKSSLIKALASHFNLNVCRLNLNALSDDKLEEALASIPSHSILAIEDFDSASATRRRQAMKDDDGVITMLNRLADDGNDGSSLQSSTNEPGKATDPMSRLLEGITGLTLSGILNALDGMVSLHGTLIFLTTNTLDEIDPAVIRKGRVDHIFEIKPLTHKEVLDYIELMFPGRSSNITGCFSDILGCDLQALYFEHHDSFDQFIAALPKQGSIEDTLRPLGAMIKAA